MAGMAMLLQSSALISPAKPIYSSKASTPKISHITYASTSANDYPSKIVQKEPQICQDEHISRRHGLAAAAALILIPAAAAKAEFIEEYKVETQDVIDQVRKTLSLEKSDPAKPDAVAALRQTSNYWVAKYRREKQVAGKPSFSNMYSVLNAISGHYISFGPASNIPAKRQQRILQEVTDAEKALKRGRNEVSRIIACFYWSIRMPEQNLMALAPAGFMLVLCYHLQWMPAEACLRFFFLEFCICSVFGAEIGAGVDLVKAWCRFAEVAGLGQRLEPEHGEGLELLRHFSFCFESYGRISWPWLRLVHAGSGGSCWFCVAICN